MNNNIKPAQSLIGQGVPGEPLLLPQERDQNHIAVQNVAQPKLQSLGSKFLLCLRSLARITAIALTVAGAGVLAITAPYVLLAIAVAVLTLGLIHHYCKSRREKQEKILVDNQKKVHEEAIKGVETLLEKIQNGGIEFDSNDDKTISAFVREGRALQRKVSDPEARMELGKLLDSVEETVSERSSQTSRRTSNSSMPSSEDEQPMAEADEAALAELEAALDAQLNQPKAKPAPAKISTDEKPQEVQKPQDVHEAEELKVAASKIEIRQADTPVVAQAQPAVDARTAQLLKRMSRTLDLRDLFVNIPQADMEEYKKNGKIAAYLADLKTKAPKKFAALNIDLNKQLDEAGQAKLRKLYLDVLKQDNPEKYRNLNADMQHLQNDPLRYKMLSDLSAQCADSEKGDWIILICLSFLRKAQIVSWEPVANKPGQFTLTLAKAMKGKQKLDIIGESTFSVNQKMTVQISNDAKGIPTLTFPDYGFGLTTKVFNIALDKMSMARGPNSENASIEEDKILLGLKNKGWAPLPLSELKKSTENGAILINTINWDAE